MLKNSPDTLTNKDSGKPKSRAGAVHVTQDGGRFVDFSSLLGTPDGEKVFEKIYKNIGVDSEYDDITVEIIIEETDT